MDALDCSESMVLIRLSNGVRATSRPGALRKHRSRRHEKSVAVAVDKIERERRLGNYRAAVVQRVRLT